MGSAQSVKEGLVEGLVDGARVVGQGLDEGTRLHGNSVLVGIVSGVLVVVAGALLMCHCIEPARHCCPRCLPQPPAPR